MNSRLWEEVNGDGRRTGCSNLVGSPMRGDNVRTRTT